MFSLNVPLPPAVDRLAADLHPKLAGFDRVRERHTLVCKRFGVEDVPDPRGNAADGGVDPGRPRPPKPDALAALKGDLRPLLAGTDPFEVAVTGIGSFERPTAGSGPVVYLAVESDGIERLHRRLCVAYGAIEGIEGDAYVPHVTLARGGEPETDPDAVDRVLDVTFDPIRWRVHALDLYDPEFREIAATVAL